jgi:hypothetical protein
MYWLAIDERQWPFMGTTSRAPDSHRAIWKEIWGCPAPKRYASSHGDLLQIVFLLGIINANKIWKHLTYV